jgi:hypothetical protein
MGTVFKKTVSRPLPAGAEIINRKGERLARWRVRGKLRTAPVTTGADGTDRIPTESPYYVAKYRDGAGIVRTVATGCRDEQAARQTLADLERRAELVRSKVMTAAETTAADHHGLPIGEHLDAFQRHMEADGATAGYVRTTRHYLDRLARECGFGRLADLQRERLESWLVNRAKESMSARSRNAHRDALVCFANWYVGTDRLTVNPFGRIPKANEKSDPRRRRRAMDETELVKLLAVARERPLFDALTVRTGRWGWRQVCALGVARPRRRWGQGMGILHLKKANNVPCPLFLTHPVIASKLIFSWGFVSWQSGRLSPPTCTSTDAGHRS